MEKTDLKEVIKLIKTKKYRKARVIIDSLLKTTNDPNARVLLLMLKILILSLLKKYKLSKKIIIKVSDRKIYPDLLRAMFVLKSYIFFKSNEKKKALYYAKKAERTVTNGILLKLLIPIYQRYGEVASLRNIYQKILKQNSKDLSILRRFFLFTFKEGKINEADRLINKIISIKSEPIAVLFKCVLLSEMKKFEQSKKYCRRLMLALSKRKDGKDILIHFIEMLINLHKLQEAASTTQIALEYFPKNKKLLHLNKRLRVKM